MSDPLLPPQCGFLPPRVDFTPAYTGPRWDERRARTWAVVLLPFAILAAWAFVR